MRAGGELGVPTQPLQSWTGETPVAPLTSKMQRLSGNLHFASHQSPGSGDIETLVVGGKRDSVRRVTRNSVWIPTLGNSLHNTTSVGMRIVDCGHVAIGWPLLAPVGEPEVSGSVKDEIVGTAEFVAVAV